VSQFSLLDAPCPCGTKKMYAECCGPRHSGLRPAETAEALMRSRYSAFATGNGKYLVETGLADKDADELSDWSKSVFWLGLEVTAREKGKEDDTEGMVAFVARYLENGAEYRLVERSRFLKKQGRWKYVDGIGQRTKHALGRNDPCPCGSGKKFKVCHA
jgi:SEC-C motif-containing protein